LSGSLERKVGFDHSIKVKNVCHRIVVVSEYKLQAMKFRVPGVFSRDVTINIENTAWQGFEGF
jgi:hypothetical protein